MISDHFNELTAVLAVSDMEKSLEFYQNLDFSVVWTWPDEETCDQAGIKIDKNYHRDQFQLTLSDNPQNTGWLFINVSDIDSLYQTYKDRNIKFVQEIDNFPWGYREFWIDDPDGNQLRFTMELEHSG